MHELFRKLMLWSSGLSIQKLHKMSMDCVELLNSPNPVLGQPTIGNVPQGKIANDFSACAGNEIAYDLVLN